MKNFLFISALLMGCSNGMMGLSDSSIDSEPSQYNQSLYGNITIRINQSNITAAQLATINAGIERAKAIGPNFTVVTTLPDIELSKTDYTGSGGISGCTVNIDRSSRSIVVGGECFDPANPPFAISPESAVTAALVAWTGNQRVCREGQTTPSECRPCISNAGPALSNSICVEDDNFIHINGLGAIVRLPNGTTTSFRTNSITQLDLDEYRRNHP